MGLLCEDICSQCRSVFLLLMFYCRSTGNRAAAFDWQLPGRSSRLPIKRNFGILDESDLMMPSDTFLTNAGEVGDGPDQGHSGGADSVPPAPLFCLGKHAACRI